MFYRNPELKGTTQKIIEIIKENPFVTREKLAKMMMITADGVKYHLNNLKKSGILKRKGGRKSGQWEIVETHNAGQ